MTTILGALFDNIPQSIALQDLPGSCICVKNVISLDFGEFW